MYSRLKVTTFNERFNQLCSESSKTDSQIANKLEVSKQTVSAWKNGSRSPKPPTIAAISRFFHVSIQWLLGFDVPRYEEEYTAREEGYTVQLQHPESCVLARHFDQLPEESRLAIMKMFNLTGTNRGE